MTKKTRYSARLRVCFKIIFACHRHMRLSKTYRDTLLSLVQETFPTQRRGRPRVLDPEDALDSLFLLIRTGMQWRELVPARVGGRGRGVLERRRGRKGSLTLPPIAKDVRRRHTAPRPASCASAERHDRERIRVSRARSRRAPSEHVGWACWINVQPGCRRSGARSAGAGSANGHAQPAIVLVPGIL
jgi:hypothetical protein